ncbi:MAG TPA: PLP-dependent aminotransferase family protein [Blastocatellia bacterium]|nr:PLP-dependent aminotransferase family protein [Blastocatellia bacterium]
MLKTEIDYAELLSDLGRGLQSNAIRKLTVLLGRREVISLAAGAPSPDTFPIEELSEIARQVITDRGRVALQYGPTKGQSTLVEAVVDILRSRGIGEAKPTEVVMTSGSQQGLDFVSRILLNRGDVALVELPSYIGGIIALQNTGAELVGIRQDDNGIVTSELRETLDRIRSEGRRAKCIYTIPNFQNPSGVTLDPARRRELVEIAEENDLLIVEDDAYFDLYLDDSSRLAPIAAIAPERVLYLGTFSKVLAPGLRAAYVRAPEQLAAKIELAKEGADLSSSVLDQAIVMEAIRRGLIEKRLGKLREFYNVRRLSMFDALERFAPAGSRWTKPAGGFFVLLELAEGIDTGSRLLAAIDNGVAYVPGAPFFVDGSGQTTIRLAYSRESPERIAEGVELMCGVLKL